MASTMRARWVLVAWVLLIFLAGGAVFSALTTPSYRAIATVDDPDQEIRDAAYLRAEFLAIATESHGAWLTNSAVISVNRSAGVVELVADSRSSGAAQDFAQIYADLVIEQSRTVTPLRSATFPTEPRSPNLTRTAAMAAIAGLAAGALLALAAGRRQSQPEADGDKNSTTSDRAREVKVESRELADARPRVAMSPRVSSPRPLSPGRTQLRARPGVKPRVVSPRPTPSGDREH